MQPMARPGVKHYPEARPLAALPASRALLGLDALAHLVAAAGIAVAAVRGQAFLPLPVGLGLAAAALATAAAALGALGLRPLALTWRRRLALLAAGVAVWRGGPLDDQRLAIVTLVAWSGVIWITTLVEGRRISASVAEATGEEGLGDDPSRHL
jgi:hypothetical protein